MWRHRGPAQNRQVPPATFIGNNQYSYTTDCYHFDGRITPFKRSSNGRLTQLNLAVPFPASSAGSYCGFGQAADPTNHVAIAMQAFDGLGDALSGVQLGAYTVASDGSMSTVSTAANMPTVAMGNVTNINMAPSRSLLAVARTNGLQLFRFNGANPITHYSGLFTSSEVDGIFWNRSNHLYVIGAKANRLWVFTARLTGYRQAPGLQYIINNPQA